MKKRILTLIFINALLLSPGHSQQIPIFNTSGTEWSDKISPLLKMQLNIKNSLLQVNQKTQLNKFENLGIRSDDPDNQLIYLFFEAYPLPSQIAEIENAGGTVYRESWIPAVGAHPYGFILALVPIDNLNNISSYQYVKKIDTAEKNLQPNNDNGTADISANNVWQAGFEGTGVVVGVLDSGLDSDFADFPALIAGIDYSSYPLTDSNIENITSGHGTHVTGSVLGRGTLSGGTYKGAAPDAGLVFIKIGGDLSSSASTAAMTNAIRDAVDIYNVDIITMSYGGWSTYHDGTTAEAQAVDYAVSQGVPVFISAGNDANDGWHYSGTVSAGLQTGYIQVNVSGAGTNNTALAFNLVWYDGLSANNVLDVDYYDSSFNLLARSGGSSQSESSRGTESEYTNYSFWLPSGSSTYYVRVQNNSTSDQDFHLYYNNGFNSGSASVTFQNPNPFYTLGSPATADSAIAVGAHISRKYWTNYLDNTYSYSSNETVDEIATFSSRGPRVDEVRKITITAPGSAIISAKDPVSTTPELTIDNDGTNNDGPADYYIMQGTSMACPIAAGAAALLLQQDPSLQPSQLRNLLINNTDSDAFTGSVPNDTWGYGKLNIEKTLEANLPGEIANQTVNATGPYSFSGTDISMNFSVSGTNGYVAATEINNTPPGGTTNVGGSLHHVSSIRYWQIETNKTGFTTSITFNYDPVTDGIQDENTLRIARRENDGESWLEYADITRTPGSDQITANNVTGFSQWIFASEAGDNALPVTLTSFNCAQVDNKIQINWTTESELENFGFNLYRAEKDDINNPQYSKINDEIINGAGNSSSQHEYTFEDLDVEYNKTYFYLLEDISFSGEVNQSEPVEIVLKAPMKYALFQNYPNPFNPGTNIKYTVGAIHESPVHVLLKVYDISGKEIKTLVNKRQSAGKYTVTFDASDLAGGIYIYNLKIHSAGRSNSFEQSKKMLLLK